MPVIECDPAAARARLEAAGLAVEEGNTEHERWRARTGDATAVAYDDKVVVQGRAPEQLVAMLRQGASGGSDPGADRPASQEKPASRERSQPQVGARAHVYFDGASRGNPGPAAVGWVVVSADGIVAEGGNRIGEATNNRAEYEALVRALEVAREYGFEEVQVRGDSELVVRQVRGEYDATDPDLRERRVRVRELLEEFEEWSIDHVPREINERADERANEALDVG